MKVSARIDLDLPRATVFAAVSDLAAAEARLAARGVEITRVVDRTPPGPGIAWTARARLRGRSRDIASELTVLDPAQGLTIRSRIGGMVATLDVRVVALAADRTRVITGLDLRATTLKARVMLQALRLAKGRIRGRLERGLAAWGDGVISDQRRRGSAG
ncbi:MAG: SRPBCC family protein [Rhodobacteraceae bacterium]|jgi:hypothetical protein|nr:SRPBCC family protein [Paracoccaceae bacterium]